MQQPTSSTISQCLAMDFMLWRRINNTLNNFRERLGLTGLMLVSLLSLAACVTQPTSPAATSSTGEAKSYIATFDNGPANARTGIVVEDGKYKAYVCSLDNDFNLTSARWYEGELAADGSFQGVSPDGVQFKGSVNGDQYRGSIVNTAKKTLTFKGTLVPAGGKVGLYRGERQFEGKDIVIGAVISPDNSFASTVQVKGKIEFVTPVGNEPAFLPDNTLGIKLGKKAIQVTAKLVTTLKS